MTTYASIRPHDNALAGAGGLKKVASEQEFTHVLEKVEYVPFQGIMIYCQNALYPKKGFPTVESVFAVNVVKTLTIQFFVLSPVLLLFGKDKVLSAYNEIANRAMDGYRLQDFYLCKASYAIFLTIFHFLKAMKVKERIAIVAANNIAHIFEYDDAWRYRLQDLITETSFEELKKNPQKEIDRVLGIYLSRDFCPPINKKVKGFVFGVKLSLRIPFIKRAFINSLHLDNAKFDEGDWYWVCQRNDYLFGGKTYEERSATITQFPTQIPLTPEMALAK